MKSIYLLIFLLSASTAPAGEIVKHYDQSYNITGYTIVEDGRETHYEKFLREGRYR